MAWCFVDETTPATAEVQDRLKRESAIVPSHWFLEVANALAMAERRKRIEPSTSDEFISLLGSFRIDTDDNSTNLAFTQVLALARSHQLTTYDAAYLELSQRQQLPLASLDLELRAAAK
jgi:predicted nucleic acid-binding protein